MQKMAFIEQGQTIAKVNEMCGNIYSPDQLKELLAIGEKGINSILDASIIRYYSQSVFTGPRQELLAPWKRYMLGEQAIPEAEITPLSVVLPAMYLKWILCSKHAPFGLIRRNLFRDARILDVFGGLGFWSAVLKLLGAKPVLADYTAVSPFVAPELKKAIKTSFNDLHPLEVKGVPAYNGIFFAEVLHNYAHATLTQWFEQDLPAMLTKEGNVFITDIDPTANTLYASLFPTFIKHRTGNIGAALAPHDVIAIASKTFAIRALVTWHSLPYYTLIMYKK